MKPKPIEIINPPKRYWPGDSRVEKFMSPVSDAIKRHVEWPSAKYTDIYNRAYEAVYLAIKSMEIKKGE